MQKAPAASVSSGQVAPTIIGPDKESKEIYLISGLVLFLAAIVAAFWFYSQLDETGRGPASRSSDSAEALSDTQVPQVITSQSTGSASHPIPIEAAPLATRTSDILHDDILFEIGRKGLTEDGKAALIRHAEFLNREPDWGVVLQGYTDQQGSMSYNKALGLKRADTVKQHLMSLGVPETAIRTVSLGEEGALCLDTSDTCRRMNRRVHLELRKVGREHMVVPAVEISPVIGEHHMAIESGSPIDETQGAQDNAVESTPIVPESGPASESEETILSISPE